MDVGLALYCESNKDIEETIFISMISYKLVGISIIIYLVMIKISLLERIWVIFVFYKYPIWSEDYGMQYICFLKILEHEQLKMLKGFMILLIVHLLGITYWWFGLVFILDLALSCLPIQCLPHLLICLCSLCLLYMLFSISSVIALFSLQISF